MLVEEIGSFISVHRLVMRCVLHIRCSPPSLVSSESTVKRNGKFSRMALIFYFFCRSQEERCSQKYQALKRLKYFKKDMERLRQLDIRAEREHVEDEIKW